MSNLENLGLNALSDAELEDVTGGAGNKKGFNKNGNNPVTKMKCKFCGYEVVFAGHFEDKTLECRRCQKKNALEPVK